MNIEERLWNYLDGTTGQEETSEIEKLIASNLEWKRTYAEVLEAHTMLKEDFQLDEPSMRFTQNVMEEIGKLYITPATKTYINKNVIWGIGAFFVFMIIAILGYGLSQINWSAGNSGDTSLPIDFSKVDFSVLLNNTYSNIFIMVNIVLGLALLDGYLRKKMKKEVNS
ncbi:MAG: hypothetical protein ACXWCR_13760 [Flavitalea sp.]